MGPMGKAPILGDLRAPRIPPWGGRLFGVGLRKKSWGVLARGPCKRDHESSRALFHEQGGEGLGFRVKGMGFRV